MKELTQAVIVLEKQPATVTVVIHGYMDGGQFVVRHTEVDRDSTEVIFGEQYQANTLRSALNSAKGLTATTDDEVKVDSVLLKDGAVIEPWKYEPGDVEAALRAMRGVDLEGDSIESAAGELLVLLREMGLASATVEYSGSGDSGDAEYVEWEPLDGNTDEKARAYKRTIAQPTSRFDEKLGEWVTRTEEVDIDLEHLLLDFTNRVVSHYHSGYENNDGGSGNVYFNVNAGTVNLHHEDYYTESSSTDTELFVASKKEDGDAPSGS